MKKILSVFMVVVSMISCIFGMTCYASEYEKDELRGNIYENQTSKKFSMVEGETVFINDMPNKLYITFESQSEAIEGIKELIPELLLELASQYNLEELNNSNWIQYEDCMYQYREKCNDLSLLNQMDELVSFFDIYENYDKKLSLEDMSDKFHISRSYLSKKFKAVTGFGFKEYIVNVRIKNACRLLLETNKSITDIAFECGFNDSNYFGDAFRHVKGVSPNKYRKNKEAI